MRLDLNTPVCYLSGNEFSKTDGRTFAQQVLEFFKLQGGIAISPWGEVLLDIKAYSQIKLMVLDALKQHLLQLSKMS